jgi:phospholipase/carboxylesterase
MSRYSSKKLDMSTPTQLHTIELETKTNPTASIIWMHGLGADGNDFVPIVHELDVSSIGGVRFVFPNAPQIPVTLNGGYVMPAWYDIYSLEPGAASRREDSAGLHHSRLAIEALIAKEVARGVPAHRIVIAGFSQGCAMALLTGLRHTHKLAGIMALSGYLPLADKTGAERSAANQSTPIFMAHGRQDNVVVIARAHESRDALQALGYTIEWHDYPMSHSVCPQEIADINAWLLRVLAA